MNNLLLWLSLFATTALPAQTNLLLTNPVAEQILLGTYDPADYVQSAPVQAPAEIVAGLQAAISPDSLKAFIIRLSEFG